MIETPGSLCQAAGSPRGPRPPPSAPGPCSARGQFSSPFLLRRDSNQTTRSAEEGEPHANPLAAPGRGVSGSQRVPLNRPVPLASGTEGGSLGEGPRGCLRPLQGPREPVPLRPQWEPKPGLRAALPSVRREAGLRGCANASARQTGAAGAAGALRPHRPGGLWASSGWWARLAGSAAWALACGSVAPREGGRERGHWASPKPAN